MNENAQTVASQIISPDDVLFIALELGEHILRSGGEIGRAEDTITRICKAYGATHVDVTAILSMIVLTVDFHDSRSTCTRRIKCAPATNLDRLAKINMLSRKICAELPSKKEVIASMGEINRSSVIRMPRFIIGNMLAAFGFAVFFSSFTADFNLQSALIVLCDGLISGALAIPLCLIAYYMDKSRINSLVSRFAVCFLGGAAAMLICHALPFCHADKIMIGNVMNFIPGVAMTNSFRDLFGGDIMSGLFRLCSVIIDAIVVAAGYAVAILLLGSILGGVL